jgi:hypothetical protein
MFLDSAWSATRVHAIGYPPGLASLVSMQPASCKAYERARIKAIIEANRSRSVTIPGENVF